MQFHSSATPGKNTTETIQALTIIDKATGWPEFVASRNKTFYHISILFDSKWLCRYPKPRQVIYDNGTDFTRGEFQELLQSYGIQLVSTTMRNPRSNGVIERVHLTMGDMLQTMKFSGNHCFKDIQGALDAAVWAVRTSVNPTIKYLPCHLACNQDMIVCHAVKKDWASVRKERNQLNELSNNKENKSRIVKNINLVTKSC
jgi:transposase InsO family protein